MQKVCQCDSPWHALEGVKPPKLQVEIKIRVQADHVEMGKRGRKTEG